MKIKWVICLVFAVLLLFLCGADPLTRPADAGTPSGYPRVPPAQADDGFTEFF
ncbi:MAG: hypothetical protein AB1441_08020 [Bacillota bacterium]